MARTISKLAADAFIDGRSFRRDNTDTHDNELYLHAKLIAWRDGEGSICVTPAGYNTNATRERLNAVLEAAGCPWRFTQKDFDLRLDGESFPANAIVRVLTKPKESSNG